MMIQTQYGRHVSSTLQCKTSSEIFWTLNDKKYEIWNNIVTHNPWLRLLWRFFCHHLELYLVRNYGLGPRPIHSLLLIGWSMVIHLSAFFLRWYLEIRQTWDKLPWEFRPDSWEPGRCTDATAMVQEEAAPMQVFYGCQHMSTPHEFMKTNPGFVNCGSAFDVSALRLSHCQVQVAARHEGLGSCTQQWPLL